MKQITIRPDKYGRIANLQDLYLKFGNENLTTQVTVDFEGVKEWYDTYVKYAYIFVGKTRRATFYTSVGNTLTFLLTQEDLQTGYITIQPAAKLPNANPELIKHVQWEHIKFDIKKSYDPITQDTTITISLGTLLQNQIDLINVAMLELQGVSAALVQDVEDLQDTQTVLTDAVNSLDLTKMNVDGLNSNVKHMRFDTTDAVDLENIGEVHWSPQDRTLELKISDTVDLSIGKEVITDVRNVSGSTILKGQVVYVNGSTGNQQTVLVASNDNPAVWGCSIGVALENINNNGVGFMSLAGVVTNLNTSGLTEGSPIYLGLNGALTMTLPTKPAVIIRIGTVTRVHSSLGSILVAIITLPPLQSLSNVQVDSVANNQVVAFNSTNNRWENKTFTKSDVGLSNVDNTSDVNKPISTATQSALDGKANTVHTHVKADITDFAHTHPISEVTNLQTSLDAKANKVQEAWITPTLINGWVQDDTRPFRYRIDQFGKVKFKGKVNNGTVGQIFFTLPAGYRPPHQMFFACVSNNTIATLRIEAAGSVFVNTGNATAGIFCDNVEFYNN